LAAILKNHLISGQVTLAKALELREGATLLGSKVSVRFDDGRVKVGAANLVKADIQASNGIIHVIDQVLIPATPEATASSPAKLIELAIERGVPLFNKGETAACAALYEITCEALQTMDKLCDQSRKEIADALQSARAESSPRQQAWTLREGLDLVRARLQNQKG
jgi:hypothetical protein